MKNSAVLPRVTVARFAALIAISLICQPHADAAGPAGPTERRGVVLARVFKGARYPYLAVTPAGFNTPGQRWPLIVYLHGSDQRGNDLNLLKLNGPPKFALDSGDFPFVVVAPQCPLGKVWDGDAVAAFVRQVMRRFRVDPARVYLTGISMGGYGTWAAGIARPEQFAAIVPVSGGGDTLVLKHAEGTKLEALRDLAIWAFHGGSDSTVDPHESQRMADEFRAIGAGDVGVTIYPGAPHDIWDRVYGDAALYDWLLQHSRP